MMMNNLLYKALKYVALAISIYLIFRFVPNQPLNMNDSLMITVIVVLLTILFESLCNLYNGNDGQSLSPVEKAEVCSDVCPLKKDETKEHMENISAITDMFKAKVQTSIDAVKTVSAEATSKLNEHLTKPKNEEHKVNITSEEIENSEKSYDEMSYEEVESEKQMLRKRLDDLDKKHGVERTGSRENDGVITNEMSYDNLTRDNDAHHLPLMSNYSQEQNFEYGYSFLPPDKWYPTPPFPPVCVSEKRCPVCPLYTTGTPLDVKEWKESTRITPPDNINTKYIREKLNSGR
jgi:hypothetical protein